MHVNVALIDSGLCLTQFSWTLVAVIVTWYNIMGMKLSHIILVK